MPTIVDEYNIFVDTQRNVSRESTGESINLPLQQVPISCGGGQKIRLELQEFSMYKSWTDINSNNNTFTIRDAVSITEGKLIENNYSSFYDLFNDNVSVIADALSIRKTGSTGGVTGVLNAPASGANLTNSNGKFVMTFTYSTAHGYTTTASGVQSTDLLFQTYEVNGKSYKILGTKKIANDANTTLSSALVEVPSATTVKISGFYIPQLNSENYVYVRLNEQSSNIEMDSLSIGDKDTQKSQMTSSRILGIIPIDTEYIRYVAATDATYFADVTSKQITNLRIQLTDSLGRPFPLFAAGQSTLGNRDFSAVIKVQIRQMNVIETQGVSQNHPLTGQQTNARYSSNLNYSTNTGDVPGYGKNGEDGYYGSGFIGVDGQVKK